ncbi:hypothetical protein NDU88_003047 [Pleurodeles waltl]|uniref:Uncharacterized protein n=1 Tax=Pleurodeles waltl TaxID=8319 RepID=A0AAV7RC32_PLEWA|nr:hypothetical protein NDU88_003047 [Pleurodeles waltl]
MIIEVKRPARTSYLPILRIGRCVHCQTRSRTLPGIRKRRQIAKPAITGNREHPGSENGATLSTLRTAQRDHPSPAVQNQRQGAATNCSPQPHASSKSKNGAGSYSPAVSRDSVCLGSSGKATVPSLKAHNTETSAIPGKQYHQDGCRISRSQIYS